MSITNIKKRIACFYDDKGEFIGKKAFSKTDKLLDYEGRTFNIFQDGISSTKMKRWYWDVEQYHYNINNPNPFLLNKKCEPKVDSEVYNIQLKTKVMRDLNDLSKGSIFGNLNAKTIFILAGVAILLYLLFTKKIAL